MATTTPNLGLTKPTVGADADAWGGQLNASLDTLDAKVLDKTTGGTVSGPISVTNLSYSGSLTGGTGVINIGSGQVYKDAAGNVGIGTSSPGAKLDVRGFGGGLALRLSRDPATDILDFYQGGGVSYIDASLAGTSLAFATGGTSRMRLDPAGNLGLSVTPSAWNAAFRAFQGSAGSLVSQGTTNYRLWQNAYIDSGAVQRYVNNGFGSSFELAAGEARFFTAPSGTAGATINFRQDMTLTQGGSLLVGTTSNANNRRVLVNGTGSGTTYLSITDTAQTANEVFIGQDPPSSLAYLGSSAFGIGFSVGNTERARITSAGFAKFSNTGSYGGVAGLPSLLDTVDFIVQSNANNPTVRAINSNIGSSVTNYQSALASGSAGFHFNGILNAALVYQVLANGNVQNTNNSYGAISDAKLKTVTGDAPSYWDKYKKIHWLKYLLKADPTNTEMLGVVAQELEQIFPGLIERTPDTVEVTKTRTVTKTKPATTTQQQTTTSTEIKFIDGVWREIVTTKTEEVDVPVFDEFPLVDAAGNPVMEVVEPEVPAVEAQDAVLDEEGNVVTPAVPAQPAKPAVMRQKVHKVPRTVEYVEVEEYTEREPNGEFTLAVKYSVLGMIADVVTQEAQQRIEQLEQRLAALEQK